MLAVRYALPWLIVLLLAAIAVALLVAPAEALFTHIPRNYNEGWNAFHAQRLRSGGPLYPPISEATFINYPPLSFYLVAALHPLFGDDIFAGRTIALVAELAVAINIALIARALRVSWPLAVATACLFIVFAGVFYEDAVAIDDPQWLGQALQLTGLTVLIWTRRTDWRALLAVALLCLLGGLAKQSLVALPLAITLWLAVEDRRALLRWIAICATLLALALGGIIAVHGWGFVDQALLSQRSFWLNALTYVAGGLWIWLAIYGIFAVGGFVVGRADPYARLIAIYFVVALVVGTALLAINGVGYSALFDFTIASLLGTALLFDWATKQLASAIIPPLAVLAPTLPILILGPLVFAPQSGLREDLGHQDTWQQVIDQIAATKGDAACEMLSLCYWAGHPSTVDFFNLGQYAGLHPAFAVALTRRVETHQLAIVQEDTSGGSHRLPASVNDAIAGAYVAIRTAPTTLLIPSP
jgi:4-amino-4-deoxy-L-arabinose transferase-like glycosyltransferase